MRWQPAHETHAIERVTVSFMFAEPISTKPWQTLLALASRELLRQGYQAAPDAATIPQNINQNNPGFAQLIINIGTPQAVAGNVAGQMPNSRTFSLIDAGEARDEIVISRGFFLITTSYYRGWADFRARIASVFDVHLNLALNTVNISAIKMEYWDRFVSSEPTEMVDYSDILNRNSKYIPSFGFETGGLWHSHVGVFGNPGSSELRLINLNVDVVDIHEAQAVDGPSDAPAQRRSVGIYSMVQDTLKPSAPLESAEGAHSTLDEMHTILKLVLADAITGEAADRIALNP
ncbi:TIGR04255 family protein [Methylobacterium sp. V23]|uniref:TIGR04255 family protein n=1 Tax=Methylobacterium sp. V23 TaxID=2044878 RepID=UPI000CDA867B|nr:TIGR04255 family protein [Methylobacterium sp. V23]POR40514.1 hypothetical protein CRT23_23465 [Methylobacterium sp. V23]